MIFKAKLHRRAVWSWLDCRTAKRSDSDPTIPLQRQILDGEPDGRASSRSGAYRRARQVSDRTAARGVERREADHAAKRAPHAFEDDPTIVVRAIHLAALGAD